MKKIKVTCDRCKDEIEDGIVPLKINISGRYDPDFEIDLCDDCKISFVDFYNIWLKTVEYE